MTSFEFAKSPETLLKRLDNPTSNLRVCIVSEEYPPVAGGIGISCQRLASSFRARDSFVSVCTFDSSVNLELSASCQSTLEGNFALHRVGPFFTRHPNLNSEAVSEFKKSSFRRRVFDQMLSIVKAEQPHVIIAFGLANAGLVGSYLANAIGIPCIASARGNDVSRGIFSYRELAAIQRIVSNVAKITCVNNYLREQFLIAFPESAKKIVVIQNGTEIPEYEPKSRDYIESRAGWNENDVVAVFIGVARDKKGIDIMLSAFSSLASQNVKLLIVGACFPPPGCKKLYEDLVNDGTVHCTGYMPREKALKIAAQGDIVLMPSIEDGLANGLLEGMALGLAPLVTDIFSDVISSDQGVIIPKGDAGALARALTALAASKDQRVQLGKNARDLVISRFSADREYREYISLIRDCIKYDSISDVACHS